MGKNVRNTHGALRSAALVVVGWTAFGVGICLEPSAVKIALLTVARVLPPAL